MIVPVLPSLDARSLAAHAVAHDRLAGRWSEVVARGAGPVARLIQRHLLLESHANVQPIRSGRMAVQLFPRPRAFLTAQHESRMRAAAAAFRHVGSRVEMVRRGELSSVIEQSTPTVLNGIIQGFENTGYETSAGILRVTESTWLPEVDSMQPPPATAVRSLVEAAIDVADRAPVSGIARAGWLAFTMMSIHPFVDGNGRTARMLFQALASVELPLGMDWGAVEQFSLNRAGYLDALRSGQQHEAYDAERLDAVPFMRFALECSTAGAILSLARLDALIIEHERLVADGLTNDAANVYTWVSLCGIESLRDLEVFDVDVVEMTEIVNTLVEAGLLRWSPIPASRRDAIAAPRFGLIAVSR